MISSLVGGAGTSMVSRTFERFGTSMVSRTFEGGGSLVVRRHQPRWRGSGVAALSEGAIGLTLPCPPTLVCELLHRSGQAPSAPSTALQHLSEIRASSRGNIAALNRQSVEASRLARLSHAGGRIWVATSSEIGWCLVVCGGV